MGDTVQRPSIHDLPHEMLEQLLRHLPTADLLFNCRLVCQLWSQLATTICRTREVIVTPGTNMDYFSEDGFRNLFMTPTSIRWTGIDLEFTDSPDAKAINAHLCEDFGPRILSLSATIQSSTESDFLDALRKMPNLKQLHICLVYGLYSWEPGYQRFTFPKHGEIELLQLEDLRVTNNSTVYLQYDELLEFLLLHTGAQLKSVYLPYVNSIDMQDEYKMANLLCSLDIPNLSLGLYYQFDSTDLCDLLAQQQFRIHALEFDFYVKYTARYAEDRFRPLERFLNNSVGLTILSLRYFRGSVISNVVSRFLQSFTLLDLKTLAITLCSDATNGGHENPMFTVHPLRSASFPNLENFDLFYLASDQESLDIELIVEPNTFNEVKYLKVEYDQEGCGIRGIFSSIFPKTTKIRTKICSLGQISSILNGMKHVTKLYIELDSMNEDELLSDAIEYIVPLKTLRVLTLDFSSSTESKLELSQTGALKLMHLRPLNLIIHGGKLKDTDAAVLSLREYHFGVQILKKSVKR